MNFIIVDSLIFEVACYILYVYSFQFFSSLIPWILILLHFISKARLYNWLTSFSFPLSFLFFLKQLLEK